MKPEAAFGQVLRELRQEKEVSQEKLAQDGELDRTFISLLERGKRQPSLTSILHISKALSIPASDLIKRVEKKLLASK